MLGVPLKAQESVLEIPKQKAGEEKKNFNLASFTVNTLIYLYTMQIFK